MNPLILLPIALVAVAGCTIGPGEALQSTPSEPQGDPLDFVVCSRDTPFREFNIQVPNDHAVIYLIGDSDVLGQNLQQLFFFEDKRLISGSNFIYTFEFSHLEGSDIIEFELLPNKLLVLASTSSENVNSALGRMNFNDFLDSEVPGTEHHVIYSNKNAQGGILKFNCSYTF